MIASGPLFFLLPVFIFFFSFPVGNKIQTNECCKTIREWFDLNIALCSLPQWIIIPVAPECRGMV
jgi:hypothetical protein